MSGKRLFAISVIFVLAAAAWMILAGSVEVRSTGSDARLGEVVGGLWGSAQYQEAPVFSANGGEVQLAATAINADFDLEQRRKGLLWYATYVVDFDAAYTLSNPADKPAKVSMAFRFPDPAATYDGFAVAVGGTEVPIEYRDGSAHATFEVAAGSTARVETGYRTNGMDTWTYMPSPGGVGVVRDFDLRMTTDFARVDFPSDGVSPTSIEQTDTGRELVWRYDSVVSGRPIGLVMPSPQNPGPLVSRITLFAPVSLLFFFAALILLTATSGVKLHPVHYGFLAAAFFAFHLLLAYLADQVDINVAFAIAALTSVALVFGYLRVVVGYSRALLEIAVSQIVFLVLFSYSFFITGFTGLAITVGAVLTLAFFMAKTAKVDWDSVFPKREPRRRDEYWGRPIAPSTAPASPYPQPPMTPEPLGDSATAGDSATSAAPRPDAPTGP